MEVPFIPNAELAIAVLVFPATEIVSYLSYTCIAR